MDIIKFNSIILLFLISLLGCQPSTDQEKAETVDHPIILSMQKHADSLLLDAKLSAVSIGIYKDGQTYIGHYGELDDGQGNTPTDSTIYEIASVSKTFAGTLVAQAELEGKLNLDDDIRNYLDEGYPNLEYKSHPITIKHLITHTSRLPKFLPEEMNALFDNIDENLPAKIYAITKNYNKQQFYVDLHQLVIDTMPGTRYAYSNLDTELMAHILEKIYDKDYEDLLKEKVFDKVGMPSTKIYLNEEEKKYLANGYGETRKIVPHMANSLWGAGGGVKSTLPDLINYMKFQLDTTNAVVQRSHQVLYQDENSTIGYYWPIDTDDQDGTYFGHHGGAMGTQNWFFIIPKHHLGLSIVTNQSDLETADKLIGAVNHILDDLR